MARLATVGCEIDAAEPGINASLLTLSGTVTRDTAFPRSGAAAWKCDGTTDNSAFVQAGITFVANTSYWIRAYESFDSYPTTQLDVLTIGPISATIDPTGHVALWDGFTAIQIGTASFDPLALDVYYRIELGIVLAAGSTNVIAAELRVDGNTIASATGLSVNNALPNCDWGWVQPPGSGDRVVYVDDVAINDSTGGNQNTWPGAGKIVLLKPYTDSAVGSWTLGTGTAIAGNSFPSVDNTPPVGVADVAGGSDPKQIREAAALTTFDTWLTSYVDAGMISLDTVKVVLPLTCTASPLATAAKTGAVGLDSNPTIAQAALAAGGTAGAFWSGTTAGTYPTGWKWSFGTITYNPAIDATRKPLGRVTITGGTAARIAMICFLGAYVEFTRFEVGCRV